MKKIVNERRKEKATADSEIERSAVMLARNASSWREAIEENDACLLAVQSVIENGPTDRLFVSVL